MVGTGAGSVLSYAVFRTHFDRDGKNVVPAVNDPLHKDATTYRMKGLVLSTNYETVAIFSQLFREIRTEIQRCESDSHALRRLMSEKFEALVLDFDALPNCAELTNRLRSIRPNQDVTVFGIASDADAKAAAMHSGTTFIIERPLVPAQIRSLLRTVYGRMLRSSQAYFRFNVEIPVSVARASGPPLQCTTINLSQNGMAILTPMPLIPGERLRLVFLLPNLDSPMRAEGTVIWDDAHGKVGIRFECSRQSAKMRYFEWLHDHRLNPAHSTPEIPNTAAYAN